MGMEDPNAGEDSSRRDVETRGGSRGIGRWVRRSVGASLVGLALYAGYESDRDPGTLRERYTYPESDFVTVDALDVHYRDVGPADPDAPTLVCCHGVFASLHTWERWTHELSDAVRVVSLDLPGFGLTGPHPEGHNGIQETVDFLAAFLDAVGIERASLAGSSRGGEIAWRFAVDYPDRVDRLVLVGAAGYPREETRWLRRVRDLGPLSWPLRHFTPRTLTWLALREVYGDPARITPDTVTRYHELLLRAGNRDTIADLDIQTGERSADVPRVDAPTLVLWGSDDVVIPPEHGERFASEIPGAELVVYDGVGHIPMEEAPTRTAADARAFLLDEA
jgi:pimeloyl-ACP methyl ester carboxylesterase